MVSSWPFMAGLVVNVLIINFFNFLWWNFLQFSQYIKSGHIRILLKKKIGVVKAPSLFTKLCFLPLRKNWSCKKLIFLKNGHQVKQTKHKLSAKFYKLSLKET